MYSALAYIADMKQYEPNKMLLELVPETGRNAASAVGWHIELIVWENLQ